jgi:large subunit ribosomal protein L24
MLQQAAVQVDIAAPVINSKSDATQTVEAGAVLTLKGAMVKVELPIHISKVSPMADGKPTRVGIRLDEESGKRVRISKRNGKDIKA